MGLRTKHRYLLRMGRDLLVGAVGGLVPLLIVYIITQRNEQPRPFVQLSSVEIRNLEDSTTQIQLPKEQLQRLQNHPYNYYGDLPPTPTSATVAQVRNLIDSLQSNDNVADNCLKDIRSLDKLISDQKSSGETLDRKRREALSIWSARLLEADMLKSLSLQALSVHESELSSRYRSHPETEPAMPTNLTLNACGCPFDLTELDEVRIAQDAEARNPGDPGDVDLARKNAHNENMFRRMWLIYDPSEFTEYLAWLADYISDAKSTSAQIAKQLQERIDQDCPPKLVATLQVYNRGKDSFTYMTLGVLHLSINKPDNSGTIKINVDMLGGKVPMIYMAGGGTCSTLFLESQVPLKQLIADDPKILGGSEWSPDKPLRESRIEQLINGDSGAISASISIARSGVSENEERIDSPDWMTIRRSFNDRSFVVLQE